MMRPAQIGEVVDYDSLIATMRARADQLQISHQSIDAIAGWADGLAGKYLVSAQLKRHRPDGMRTAARRLSMQSLGAMLSALGLRLIAVEDPDTTERYRDRRAPRNGSQVRRGHKWKNGRRIGRVSKD